MNQNSYLKYVGQKYQTNNHGEVLVTDYEDSLNITVEFINTGNVRKVRLANLKSGKVRDCGRATIQGFGVCDIKTYVDEVRLQEFKLWANMLSRCYNKDFLQKTPSYLGCTVHESFRYLSDFKIWCNQQIGFSDKDDKGRNFALDKDILVKGNKVYSPDTCCFVPPELNGILLKREVLRGSDPIGCCFDKDLGKYRSYTHLNKKRVHIGCHDTPEEAFQAYKQVKEAYIKEVANKWKDKIDPRVYEALMNYQVKITD